MESDSSHEENDPVLQLHEARAVIVEKNQEIEAKNRQIQEKNDEIAKMHFEIRKYEIEIILKDDKIVQMQKVIEALELAAHQKTTSLEIRPAASCSSDPALELEDNQRQLADVESRIEELTQQRNNLLVQIAAESASTFEEQNTSVLILGGSVNLDSNYLLDSKARSWKELRIILPMGMHSFGAVVLNKEIYIFGGFANYDWHQGCYKLKDDGSWMKLASLNQKRAYISSSSLVYKEDIWAIGGYSGEYLKSVEKYNIPQKKWTFMPEMNYARRHAAAAVFKDRIFVTGGWNGKYLKSVEMFDPKLQKWILFCDLPFEVSWHTMLINNSTLSIFGGDSESGRLNSVWEMDIEDPEKKWTEKQSFNHPRSDFGIGKLSNGIILFGDSGNNGETSEIFDGNEWITGPRLPQKLSFFAYTSISRSLEERFLKVSKNDNLADRLEALKLAAHQKITRLEIRPAASRSSDPALELEGNQSQLANIESRIEKLNQQRSNLLVQIAAENASTFEEQNTSILILGGYGYLDTIYLLDLKARSWKELSITLPMGFRDFGAVVFNEEIYIFGGCSHDQRRGSGYYTYQQGCYKLNDDGSWINLASMSQKRSDISSSSLVYKEDIWVIGGYSGDSKKYLKSVEKYNISQNKWTFMPEMNYARRHAAAAVFKDRIFITGGSNEKKLKSVEMFDPELQKWILFCDLPFEIFRHTMLISNSTLSIFGGYSGSRSLNSVWEMDLKDPKKKWTEKQSFERLRDSFGIGKLSNEIIVFGDWGESGETSEIFDGNKWITGPKLPQKLARFAFTSVPQSLEERLLKQFP